MGEIPVESKLNAGLYKDLAKNTIVFNVPTLDYFLYVHIPEDSCVGYSLYEFCDVSKREHLPIENFVERDHDHPWFRIRSGILDHHIGQHVYRLSMVHTETNIVVHFYFSYIMQDDYPDRPYDYMHSWRSGVFCNSCKYWEDCKGVYLRDEVPSQCCAKTIQCKQP